MPELPEVETVCRGLAPALTGHMLVKVVVRRKGLRAPFPKNFAKRLTGRKVTALTRRAKYILAELEGFETLVIHLGMSGRMSVTGAAPSLATHDHVAIETDAPAWIVYSDPRRFGLMSLVETAKLDADKLFKELGPEPLSDGFDAHVLAHALKGKKTPIKAALLDQRVVSGLGNIYVCEALFRAGIAPKRLAGSIANTAPLTRAIKAVLKAAIAAGGSTLRDYRHTNGELGTFQHRFAVYGREGEPCTKKGCGGRINRIVQAGRSTFYCPACQK